MILSGVLKRLEYKILNGEADIEIKSLVYDSRKVTPDSAFVCISGAATDGHKYIDMAVDKGATALIVEKDIEIKDNLSNVTVVKVEDAREALAYMSAEFFGNPASKLFTIGITGTKGKTTTSYMVRQILEECGIKTGLIGTIETIVGDEHIPSVNTTPESYLVQEYFRKMVDAGCKCVVMEVSSQGLKLNRCAGINFDIGVFTNLEADHIGPNEHSSFDEYMFCKGLLFKQCKVGIVNSDDEHLEGVIKGHTCMIETYGLNKDAMLRAEDIKYVHTPGHISTEYRLAGAKEMNVKLSLPGQFSVYNSLCAIAITRHFDIQDDLLEKALYNVKVTGRVEPVKVSDKFILMIDYAHNAMALKSILETMREYEPGRIVCLFGCGGNRSKLRRYEMGEVSGNLADLTIITSDNPRDEEPLDIIADIVTGIKKTNGKYVEIPDRKEAIKYAIENGRQGDIIILAGKGHETYQEIKGVKHPMDERVLIKEVLAEINNQ